MRHSCITITQTHEWSTEICLIIQIFPEIVPNPCPTGPCGRANFSRHGCIRMEHAYLTAEVAEERGGKTFEVDATRPATATFRLSPRPVWLIILLVSRPESTCDARLGVRGGLLGCEGAKRSTVATPLGSRVKEAIGQPTSKRVQCVRLIAEFGRKTIGCVLSSLLCCTDERLHN
jgi:hypothetical protein